MPKKVPTGMVGQVQKGLDDCACNTSLKPLQRMWRSVFTDSAAAQAEGEYCVVGLVGAIDTVPEWSRGWTRNPLGSARRGSNPLGAARSTAMDLWTALHAQFTAEHIGRFSGGGCTTGDGLQHQEYDAWA